MRAANHDLVVHHHELSRATIMKLADVLEPDEPLRTTVLAAPSDRKVLDSAPRLGA